MSLLGRAGAGDPDREARQRNPAFELNLSQIFQLFKPNSPRIVEALFKPGA
jgi:hypothetical protein